MNMNGAIKEVKSTGEYQLRNLMGSEDLELCRRQLSTYAWICERLFKVGASGRVDLASLEAAEIKIQTIYSDLFSGDRGLNALAPKKKPQWNPTPAQLPILEYYFNQEFSSSSVRISFKRVKQITTELLPYGHVIDLNVYDWFQAQRAHLQQNSISSMKKSSVVEKRDEAIEGKSEFRQQFDLLKV